MKRLLLRAVATLLIASATGWMVERTLDAAYPPPVDALSSWPASTEVLAADGTVLRVTADERGERRIPVALEDVSPHLIDALLAAEDRRFDDHTGVDLRAISRAVIQNTVSGRIVSGASTLAMQLARILEPRPRNLRSKIIEAFRARQLTRRLGKEAILHAYLNLAPLGGTLRGFETAARWWFGRSARDLDAAQSATLVALLPAPTRRAPTGDPDLLLDRRDRVLRRMAERGTLSDALLEEALARPLGASPHRWPFLAPHLVQERLGQPGHSAPVVHTSIEPRLQARLENAILGHGSAADGAAGVILERVPPIREREGETPLCASPEERDGKIRALVGSPDWNRSKYNAARARRSVGSTLKPFLYALAMTEGAISAESMVDDAPLRFQDWAPGNFDRMFRGRTTARMSLGTSLNTTAIRILKAVGVDRFRDLLIELGLPVRSEVLGLDAALGTLSASPLELARAYARFADVDRIKLSTVRDEDRTAVLRMLADDRPLPGRKNDGKVAWKTGTSNGRRDAWCVAVTERLVIVVWVGNLDGTTVADLVGVKVAAPVVARLL